jgi:hypothetical protein
MISADTIRLLIEAGVTGEALLRIVESIEEDGNAVTERYRNNGNAVTYNAQKQARYRARKKVTEVTRVTVTENDAALIGTSSSKLENTGKKIKKDKPLPSEGSKSVTPVTRSIPIDAWTPSDDLKKFAAAELGVSEAVVAREMDTMRDWARAKDERKKDWDAAARNWLRRAVSEPRRPNGHGPPPKEKSVITLAAEAMRRRGMIPEKGIEDEQFTGPSIDLTATQAAHSGGLFDAGRHPLQRGGQLGRIDANSGPGSSPNGRATKIS